MNAFSRRFGLKMGAMLGAMAAAGNLVSVQYVGAVPVGETDPEATPTVGGEIIIGAVELGDTLDPHKTGSAQVSTILRYVGDSLIAKDFDGNFVPSVAESWEISEDGLVYTFKIREGITFHDGTPLTAEEVKFSFDRVMNPETLAVTAGGLIGPMTETAVIDPMTFQFTLSEPFAPILQFLTASNLSILSPTAVESMGDEFGRKPILSGQYMVEEWREGDRIILKRNPNYAWAPPHLHQDPAAAFIETVTFQSIVEDAARIAAFEAGEIHQATLPAIDIPRFQDNPDVWLHNYQRQGIVTLAFNVTKAPFDNIEVRKALMAAVNKQDVVDAAVEGFGGVAVGYLSPAQPGYWDGMVDYAPAFDPAAATAALEAAGWTDSDGDGILDKDGQKFEFTALNLPNDSYGRAAQVVQAQFADIGVTMNIQQMEFATVLEEVKASNHDAVFMGYTYTDPDVAFLLFDSTQAGAGINLNQVKDPALDDLIAQGRAATDLDARWAIYQELQKYINDQGLFVPLWYDDYYVAFAKSLQGLNWHPDNFAVYYDAWFAE
jgi:peptide/nickel transport system substrate-binding protein